MLQVELDSPDLQPPSDASETDDTTTAISTSRAYGHVTKAVFERPWAMQASVLRMVADLVHFRTAGGKFTEGEIQERLATAAQFNGDRTGGSMAGPVAVIPIYGVISQRMSVMTDMSGGTSIEAVRRDFRDAMADPAVRAVVFDVDSPGGSTDGVPEFASELRAARNGSKPIVAAVNTLAASAAYWLASQCDEIVCTPSGEVGSIGVFAAHEDDSAALEAEGVKVTLIGAGPYKTELSPYGPLGDDAKAAVQEQMDTFYSMFLKDVSLGRGVSVDKVTADYGGGRTLLAGKALKAGMVDRIGTLESAVKALQPRTQGQRALAVKPAAKAASAFQPDRGWNQRMQRRHR